MFETPANAELERILSTCVDMAFQNASGWQCWPSKPCIHEQALFEEGTKCSPDAEITSWDSPSTCIPVATGDKSQRPWKREGEPTQRKKGGHYRRTLVSIVDSGETKQTQDSVP
jgi:hypothetical protein